MTKPPTLSKHQRLALLTALCISFLFGVALLTSSPPHPTIQAQPKPTRTLDRTSPGKVTINQEFFQPFFLSAETPKPLRSAYTQFQNGQTSKARDTLSSWLTSNTSHPKAPQATFLLAYLERDVKNHSRAASLFQDAAQRLPLLEDYAHYYGAQSAIQAGDTKLAIALCKKISMASRFGARSKHLRANALLAQKQPKDAAEVYRELLEQFPKASFAKQARLDLAATYEQLGQWDDAAKIYQQTRMRYPGGGYEKQANAGLKRVRSKLSKKARARILTPSVRDRIQRATALYGRHRSKTVVSEMKDLITSEKLKPKTSTWCDATWLVARANTKLRDHKEAAKYYTSFIEKCPKDNRVIKALYVAGRGLWTVDQDAAALKMFKRLWTEYPNHSYADDAVLYAARIHRSNKNDKKYQEMLDFQVKTFPRGDMISDAHWHRFLTAYNAGRLTEAVRYVDSVGNNTGEKDLYTRGRLGYFRARALERLNKRPQAIDAFLDVARKFPMSYYALLAFNRLHELDPKRLQKELQSLLSATRTSIERALEPPQLAQDSGFQRGVTLLRLGLFDEARAEFSALQQRYPKGENLLWTVTLLFDRAGAYHLSHDIPRRRISSFGSSWPSGDQLSLYKLAYPQPFYSTVSSWSKKRDMPKELIYAIMREESGFNPRIESWANACGLMQLMVPTARGAAKADGVKNAKKITCNKLFNPDLNIRLGSQFLDSLYEDYKKHPSVAIAGYNGGYGNVNRWLNERGSIPFDLWVEEIPFGQTRGYTKRVTQSLWIYRWLDALRTEDNAKPKTKDLLVRVPLKLPPATE